MVLNKYTKEKVRVKGEMLSMIDEKILELRKKLDKAIANGQSYDEIYKISVQLDEAIWKYYCKTSRGA